MVPSVVYDEEEEGYVTGSGEYDELYELVKIRVKIHCDGDVRGMALDPAVPFVDFKQRVAAKFETTPQSIVLKFRDEDGGKVSLRDESDYELAIETARESAKGRPEGKLELWCEVK
jgi:neutrophil factor 2